MTDRRAYFRQYHQDHREERNAQRRAHYAENQEEIAARRAVYQRRYWHRVGYLKALNRNVNQRLERLHETRSP